MSKKFKFLNSKELLELSIKERKKYIYNLDIYNYNRALDTCKKCRETMKRKEYI